VVLAKTREGLTGSLLLTARLTRTPEAVCEAAALFKRIAPEVVVVRPIEADLAKLFSNVYRYIRIHRHQLDKAQ
jgi:hypothetical protein